jgi:hypothetical protein
MNESTLPSSENDSFYSKDTSLNNTISDLDQQETEQNEMDKFRVIIPISNLLLEIIQDNKINMRSHYIKKDSFYSAYIPSISIEDYLKRIIKWSCIELSTLICSIIYIDKICESKYYVLSMNNIHRMLIASIVNSTKYNEDKHLKNVEFAKIGGVSVEEMNRIEYLFFTYLGCELYVSVEHYDRYEKYFLHCINSG